MNPVTDAVINQWSSDVDRLEKELAKVRGDLEEANRKLEWLKSASFVEPESWGYYPATWVVRFGRADENEELSRDFFEAIKQCMEDRDK